MAVKLSALRVDMQGDSSSYVDAAHKKVAADVKMIEADRQRIKSMVEAGTFSARAATQLNRQIGQLDGAYKSAIQLERAQKALNAAHDRGALTTESYNRLIGLAVNRYTQAGAANDNMRRTAGLAAHDMRNLGFQINDIATMLAMGQSPFRILASQGGQVLQILQGAQGGIVGAFRDLAGRITSTLGPVGLVAAGLTAAAGAGYALYRAVQEPAKTTEQILEEHARLVGVIKDAYASATDAAGRFFEQGRETTLLQMMQNAERLRASLQTTLAAGTSSLTAPTSLGMPEMGIGPDQQANMVREQYRAFAAAISELQASIHRGAPDLERFNKEIAEIGINNPALRGTAEQLLAVSKNSTDMARQLSVAEASIRYMQGTATEADKTLLALAGTIKAVQQAAEPDALKQFGDSLSQLRSLGGKAFDGDKLQRDLAAARDAYNQGLVAIGRDTDPESYAARLKVLDDTYRRAVTGIHQANQTAVTSYDTLRQRTRDRIEELSLEAQLADKTAGAVTRMKLAHDLERAAKASHKTVTAEMREEWTRLADEMTRVQRTLAETRVRSDLQFERDQLGRDPSEAAVAARLRPIYGANYAAEMDGAIASQIRLNEQLKIGKELAGEFATGFARDLRNGVTAMDALSNALNRLADKLIDMALQNLVMGALGGILGGPVGGGVGLGNIGGTGGLLGGLFHGGGIVGQSSVPGRYIHPAYYANAPRFHKGFMPDEFPAILKRGEGVFTPAQMKAMGGRGNVIINNASGGAVEVSEKPSADGLSIDTIVNILEPVIADRIVRNRGPVARTMRAVNNGQHRYG